MSAIALQDASLSGPGPLLAGVLALLVHVIFAIIMFFGLNWESSPPEGMIVELWQDLPQPVQPPAKIEPSKPKPVQQPPKEQPPKLEPDQQSAQEKPSPPKVGAPPPTKKPDIALKKEIESPKPIEEKKPSPEDLKKKELEKKKEKEKDEAQRLEKKQAQQRQREREVQAQREAQQAAARNRLMNEIDKYKAMILAKVKSRIVMPPDLPGNPVAEFSVTLLPGGDVLDVRLRKSSGFAAFDSAVERAIFMSQPLPMPPDPALFNEFRNLNITVHYHE